MIEPYLYFNGKCSEAIDLYERIFAGKEKKVLRYSEMPFNSDDPTVGEMGELIMHAEMLINGTRVNFSDIQEKAIPGNMISLAVRFSSSDEVVHVFNQLKDGGEICMELGQQFFSTMYGCVRDKYGIGWQLICE